MAKEKALKRTGVFWGVVRFFARHEEEEEDPKTLKPEKPPGIEIGTSSVIGKRKYQEDSLFAYGSGGEAIAIVCDGMGGLAGGAEASRTAVRSLSDAWLARSGEEDFPEFLRREARIADEKVFLLKDGNGGRLEAGTTVVAAVVQDGNLYWLSVGDSKIYIIRDGEMLSVCRQHNYRLTLDQKLAAGELTREQYQAEEGRAEALISYLGMGNVSLMDINCRPFALEDGDIVLLSSDGLYKSLSEEEIFSIVRENRGDMDQLARKLTEGALGKQKPGQDNTSVAALRYCAGEEPEGGRQDELEEM